MALSGSTDFTANRDELVTAALRVCNAIASGETPSGEELTEGVQAMNFMLKSWHADGLHLFTRRRVTVLLEKAKSKYTLSRTGDLAVYSENLNETAMKAAAVATATSLDVDTTTGMTAGDHIAIVMDDGNLHVTTIASVTDGDTVVINTGLSYAAAIDNRVWWFTTKVDRPLRVLQAFIRDSSDLDTIVSNVAQEQYWSLANKTSDGRINQVYYDPQVSSGDLYVWPQTDTVTSTLELIVQKPFDDMDASTNNVEFPPEWFNAIKFNLALQLAYEYGVGGSVIDRLERRAQQERHVVMGYDQENTSITFEPARR